MGTEGDKCKYELQYEIYFMFLLLKEQYYLCGHGESSEALEASESSEATADISIFWR